MDIKGTYTFDAPIARVWELLMDPAAIAACIPGCQELSPLGEDRYRAVLIVPVAAITGNYTGTIAVADKVVLRSYRLMIEGSGRGGFVRGQSSIALTDRGEQTIVTIDGHVQVGGLIARVGQRLLEGVSRMLMDQFYACLQNKVGQSGAPTHERG
ncbi:MAG: carbon monoxide dehydrogenase subunit G [Acidobacteria bacterium]|nr:carbon monoxide dehydrogenase subunit G [Acidobacteriota bacterium]